MNTSLWDKVPCLGHVVYEPFRPLKYGKIISIIGINNMNGIAHGYVVEVKWKDGTITKTKTPYLNSLETLQLDHEKKAAKFKKLVAEGKKL